MAIFTEYEKNILKKYINGAEIPNEEEDKVLTRYAQVGFVEFGFNWGANKPTARLTESGIRHLKREMGIIGRLQQML